MVFGLRKAPGAGQETEEPTVVDNTATTPIDEKGEAVQASGIDVDASLDQLKKFKKTHQWVSLRAYACACACTCAMYEILCLVLPCEMAATAQHSTAQHSYNQSTSEMFMLTTPCAGSQPPPARARHSQCRPRVRRCREGSRGGTRAPRGGLALPRSARRRAQLR